MKRIKNIFKYYLPQQKVLRKIFEKVFSTNKCTQCKTSRILKIDVFQIAYNRNIGKLVSKYEVLLLDQANSSSSLSQILILWLPIPRASLPPSPPLSSFTLANRNPSLTQSSSCSSSVSLFCPTPFSHTPPQVLDIPNHMASQANQIYYPAVYRTEYFMGKARSPSKKWVFNRRFSFKVRQPG